MFEILVWGFVSFSASQIETNIEVSKLKSACSVQPMIVRQIPICYDNDCHIKQLTPVNLCDNPKKNYMYFEANR